MNKHCNAPRCTGIHRNEKHCKLLQCTGMKKTGKTIIVFPDTTDERKVTHGECCFDRKSEKSL
jgi:hypothetical protein